MRYKNNFFNLFPNATLNFLVDVLYKPFNEGDSTFEALGIETESSNSWVEVNLNPTNEYL